MTTITGEQALAVIEEVAAERPNRVIEKCTYVSHGQANCLVGVALRKLDVSVETLAEMDHRFGAFSSYEYDEIINDGVYSGPSQFADITGLDLTEDAWRVFQAAQESQDAKNQWKYAAAEAASVLN